MTHEKATRDITIEARLAALQILAEMSLYKQLAILEREDQNNILAQHRKLLATQAALRAKRARASLEEAEEFTEAASSFGFAVFDNVAGMLERRRQEKATANAEN